MSDLILAFQIHGKASYEESWRVIDVFASTRRNFRSRWPLLAGTCTAWGIRRIAVGWDFALQVVWEQARSPASRDAPIDVVSGRLGRWPGNPHRQSATASEVLAHECGHTAQALRMGLAYLPCGALFTLWGEGERWWNWFENEASAIGRFGGILPESVHASLRV